MKPRGLSWSLFFEVSPCPSAFVCRSGPEFPDPGFETCLIPRVTHPEAVGEGSGGNRLGLDRSHPCQGTRRATCCVPYPRSFSRVLLSSLGASVPMASKRLNWDPGSHDAVWFRHTGAHCYAGTYGLSHPALEIMSLLLFSEGILNPSESSRIGWGLR